MRVRITHSSQDEVSLTAVDESGSAIASVRSLAVRGISAGSLGATAGGGELLRLEWQRLPALPKDDQARRYWVFLGTDHLGLTEALKSPEQPVLTYQTLSSLDAGLRGGDCVPTVVIASCATEADSAAAVRSTAQRALVLVQEWLADERMAQTRLVLVTRGAIAAETGEGVPDLGGAAVWG
jgi:hypothetical protein